ncbi:peptide/nickel transport system permease protein [Actinopolymorpha cephalotaxi]|uniref:Peptide/nickel transport system permease protein n=1 Tax=Actinopolymorpha cephalotaxi TaxID=504797 RepID=A0A1I2PTY6_9ACTN|nr:ABC transporter permease [Actinopolymorpha cephalotaxi]NYH83472.1 peptide/nickel transport system permease protein [Actinopolymorpha cephalotaxi]SFG19518.1 peptide/nickel transport system permease protein [Actinopolymorpha cephalotaxi]
MADPTLLETGSSTPVAPPENPVKSKSPTQIALERLRKDKIAIVCAVIVLFFVLLAIFADAITALTHTDPSTLHQDLVDEYGFPTVNPSAAHPFGLEPRLGRDLFARWVQGSRPSLIVATSAAAISTILGTAMGLLAGFLGGWVDRAISWLIDLMLSLPLILFVFAFVPVVQSWFSADEVTVSRVRLWSLVAIFAVFGWTGLGRLVRAQVLSLREREFIQAARAIGAPTRQILFRELLPNLTGQIIVFLSLAVPSYIASEAGLSYLGIGLTEPTPSWGRTINSALSYYETYPIYFWQPALAILVLVLALNLLGDAIRDAFDPTTRR